ncbi:unnamed protein product [Toxocara canis]|uniref:TPX2_importin domain-containing protein n=1 Tax=Toxocara canis TaxID=6265 RepID=A0A183TYZ4_TOXCA|nr:unnamed protein product [Toxocara canis]
MPMSKVKQLKEKLGIKLFNKAFFGKSTVQEASQKEIAKLKNRSFTRDNAKRPREMSSKRPVSKFRNVYANERIEKKSVPYPSPSHSPRKRQDLAYVFNS